MLKILAHIKNIFMLHRDTKNNPIIEARLKNTRWDRMGYWAPAGKGKTFINTAPGSSIGVLQGLLVMFGVIALFSGATVGLLVIIAVELILEAIKNAFRRRYLKKN